ncbi:MAG: hypothetical protein DRO40_08135 [Thermoprotei archaeon]|nr:MAG: hypothetical protein DRO40_08135 [Thermoprotei archaeon]
MVSPQLLDSTWRFYIEDGETKTVNVGESPTEVLRSSRIRKAKEKFLKKHDLRNALFARKVLIGCYHEILFI